MKLGEYIMCKWKKNFSIFIILLLRTDGRTDGRKDEPMDEWTHALQIPPEWNVSYNFLFQYNTTVHRDEENRS